MSKNDSNPKVSVLVPIYNVERYLPQCLDSLVSQTLDDIEVICIDDGSTDSSPDIIARYAAEDPRIRVITKPNSGYGVSMNRGLDAARGEYIGICEPDDFADPKMFDTLFAITSNVTREIDIVKGSYWRIVHADSPDEERVLSYLHAICPEHQPFTLIEQPEFLCCHPSIWSAIYRRSFLFEQGIRFKPIPGAGWADNPFFLETLLKAKAIWYVDEPLYCYREFDDGTMSHLKDWHIIVNRWIEMDDLLRENDIHDPGILEGHYYRGCSYIEMLNQDFDVHDAAISKGVKQMVARMDYDVIYRSDRIEQPLKDAYQQHVPLNRRIAGAFRRHVVKRPRSE